jgi:hypothetical protein
MSSAALVSPRFPSHTALGTSPPGQALGVAEGTLLPKFGEDLAGGVAVERIGVEVGHLPPDPLSALDETLRLHLAQ